MPSEKCSPRLEDLMSLPPEQEADIEINETRMEGHEEALNSTTGVIERIIGKVPPSQEELIRVLNLHPKTEAEMALREEWVRTLRNGAADAWRATRNCLQEGENGEPVLTFPGIERLIEELLPPRSHFLTDFSRLQGDRRLIPGEIIRQLRTAPALSQISDTYVPPFDPESEKDVYRAITVAGLTELGRNAVQNTLGAARQKIGTIARENQVRAATYNVIVLKSIMGLFDLASNARRDAEALFQMLQKEESAEVIDEVFEAYNLDLRTDQIARLGGQLLQNIEFTLRMLEMEQRVDHIMGSFIPGPRLVRLKEKAKNSLPPEQGRRLISIIDSALHARQNAAHSPSNPLPQELEARIQGIHILDLEEAPEEE